MTALFKIIIEAFISVIVEIMIADVAGKYIKGAKDEFVKKFNLDKDEDKDKKE